MIYQLYFFEILINGYLLLLNLFVTGMPALPDPAEMGRDYWLNQMKKETKLMQKAASDTERWKTAKNAILFIGDGMGMSTVTGIRYLKSQNKQRLSGQLALSWEEWPFGTNIRTFNLDRGTTDSAASATAYHSGVKARHATIGVDGNVEYDKCKTYKPNYDTSSIAKIALAAGKSVGFVTTTRVTHASPSALYAAAASRDWEDDADVKKSTPDAKLAANCPDIASQLISKAINYTVVMGGGIKKFYQKLSPPIDRFLKKNGSRTDNRNLLAEWEQKQKEMGKNCKLIFTKQEMNQMNLSSTDCVLGLFNYDHLAYNIETPANQPSLSQMTETAIKMLSKNPKGFYLFVEGGRVDHGHHTNNAKYALTDGIELDRTVEVAQSLVDVNKTIMAITADHSHVFTLGGYPPRNVDIFAFETSYVAIDNKPYTGLGYANGPSAPLNKARPDLTKVDPTAVGFRQQSLVPLAYETHGGEDVPISVIGPQSYLFKRPKDNTYIPLAMMYAMCIGEFTDEQHCTHNNAYLTRSSFGLTIIHQAIIIFYIVNKVLL